MSHEIFFDAIEIYFTFVVKSESFETSKRYLPPPSSLSPGNFLNHEKVSEFKHIEGFLLIVYDANFWDFSHIALGC